MSPIDRRTRIFLDASILVAAAGRPEGGAGLLVSVCRRRLLTAIISQSVLLEAGSNVVEKLGLEAQARYHQLLDDVPMMVVPAAETSVEEAFRAIVGDKDAHVLAAAIAGQARFLLTLDRRLVQSVNGAGLPIRAYRPIDLILGILPAHQEFDRLREDDDTETEETGG